MSNKEFILEQLLDVSHHSVILGVQGIQIAESMADIIIETFQNQHKICFLNTEPFKKATELLAEEFKYGLVIKRPELPVLHIQIHSPKDLNQSEAIKSIFAELEKLIINGDTLVLLTQEITVEIREIISWAKSNGIKTLMLCGYPKVKEIFPDQLFYIPLSNRSRLVEIFIIFGHIVGTVMESILFSDGNSI